MTKLLVHISYVFTQVKYSYYIGLFLGFFSWIIPSLRDFLLSERSFFGLLFVALILDMIVGAWKHWKAHTFSPKLFLLGTAEKVFISLVGFILFSAIANIKGIQGTAPAEYFLIVARLAVIIYPALSALKNMYWITAGKFPPYAIMKRFESFNEKLDPKELISNDND